MQKKIQYTDEARAEAVALLIAAGYPDVKGSLVSVEQATGIPSTTLLRWFRGSNNPPPANLVIKKQIDLLGAINQELDAVLDLLEKKRADATYAQLMTALGILTDKKFLLEDKPTQNSKQLIEVVYSDKMARNE